MRDGKRVCERVTRRHGDPSMDGGGGRGGGPLPEAERIGRSSWTLLALLFAVYLCAFADRQVMSLIVEPLRADLALSDVDVSVLHGFTFALLLGLASLPAGRLVDMRRRLTLVAAGLVLWSVMTAASGLASGFGMLLLLRIGVAIGQSIFTPAAHSLISDSFPPRSLGLAFGIFGMAPYFGVGVAYWAGAGALTMAGAATELSGWAGAIRPWQGAFLVLGVAGLPLAIWVAAHREPPRRARGIEDALLPDASAVAAYFRENAASFLLLKVAVALAAMAIYAVTAWFPTFLVRCHGWSAIEAGMALGPLLAIAGASGALVGGALGDVAAHHRSDGRVLLMALAALLAVPLAIATPLAAAAATSLILLAALMFFATVMIGINPAATMAMMPNRMRGTASAIGVLIVNMVGLGIGPSVIALMTDHVFHDPFRIYRSLAILLPAMMLASSACALACARPYRSSIARLAGARR